MTTNPEGLYGIINSNRKGKDLWGKNQFNSTFPVALACWMRDQKINPVSIRLSYKNGKIEFCKSEEVGFEEIFGQSQKNVANNDLIFNFEIPYSPYNEYIHLENEKLDHIDLVVKGKDNNGKEIFLRPLEIKLTVLPDNSTHKKNQEEWGCEVVIRPDSTLYASLGIYDSIRESKQVNNARKITEATAAAIHHWNSEPEIIKYEERILNCLKNLIIEFHKYQKPFLLQPIWKTKGKSPFLDDKAFDIFIWSDFALVQLIIEQTINDENNDENNDKNKKESVSRYLRAATRIFRCINDLLTTGKTNVNAIFSQMPLGNQTDKEFAINGSKTNKYMSCPRLKSPKIPREVISQIILGGGEKHLSPERRFDATIYFTATELFRENRDV